MCIDIVQIWFGIANGQISLNVKELSARDKIMAGYYSLTFLFLYFIMSYMLCILIKIDLSRRF